MVVLAAIGRKPQAASVVETAYDLAAAYDDELIALHVIPEEDFDQHKEHIMGLPFYDSFRFSHDEEGAERFATQVVETSLSERDTDIVTTRGRVGDVVEEIISEADALEPRYLVIGGRRQSPVGKAAFGDITQQVLLKSEQPVVTLMDT